MFLQQKCWTGTVFSLKSHFFKNLKYRIFWGPGINSVELLSKNYFFLFCNEILHTISCSFINLFIYMKPSFFVFLKKFIPDYLVFLKSHYQTILENSFWFIYFWLALLWQWPPLVSEWSLNKLHSHCQTFYTQEN